MIQKNRRIIHVDMDAFYVAVEVLDNPSLKELPVIVGGHPDSRGVVCSASYEARKFGIRSAMACSIARRQCPSAIFIFPRFKRYREISRRIHDIFGQYTDQIEALALDEAWLDVTENLFNIPSATIIAQKVKQQIKTDLKLICSVGVSFNKFLAKIASDEKKPDGLFVITPDQAFDFLQQMEVRKIPGVGKVTQQKLAELGIVYGYQLYEKPESVLIEKFGKMGSYLYQRVRGIDHGPVVTFRDTKSISNETTFNNDLFYGRPLLVELKKLIDNVSKRVQRQKLAGKTLILKIKFFDFHQITRSITRRTPFTDDEIIFHVAKEKLKLVCQTEFPNKKIRLLGIGLSNFDSNISQNKKGIQLDLFPMI